MISRAGVETSSNLGEKRDREKKEIRSTLLVNKQSQQFHEKLPKGGREIPRDFLIINQVFLFFSRSLVWCCVNCTNTHTKKERNEILYSTTGWPVNGPSTRRTESKG